MARKIIGYTFIVAAILGLIFSLAGIVLVWAVKTPLTTNLATSLELIDTTLEATSSGLTVAEDTITGAVTDLGSIENTVQTAGKGIDDSVPLVESLSTLLSENLPQAINATIVGLDTMQEAAGTLESSLRLITSIPFLPIEPYDPEVSLTDSLADVSQTLEAIPESFSEMETTLNTTRGNLVMLTAQVNIIARNISELKNSLYEIQFVFDQYQEVISKLQEKLDSFQDNLQLGITITAWIFTIIFIWLGIAQVGLLTQGLERIDRGSSESSRTQDDLPADDHSEDEITNVEEPPNNPEE
jgi:methyl-accepting chemotaxis protein